MINLLLLAPGIDRFASLFKGKLSGIDSFLSGKLQNPKPQDG
jgi:hypothetical protein